MLARLKPLASAMAVAEGAGALLLPALLLPALLLFALLLLALLPTLSVLPPLLLLEKAEKAAVAAGAAAVKEVVAFAAAVELGKGVKGVGDRMVGGLAPAQGVAVGEAVTAGLAPSVSEDTAVSLVEGEREDMGAAAPVPLPVNAPVGAPEAEIAALLEREVLPELLALAPAAREAVGEAETVELAETVVEAVMLAVMVKLAARAMEGAGAETAALPLVATPEEPLALGPCTTEEVGEETPAARE